MTPSELDAIRSRDANLACDAYSTMSQAMIDRRALLAAYDALAAEVKSLRKDAERYRFIKRWARRLDIAGYSLTSNEHFEPRIDAAMGESHE